MDNVDQGLLRRTFEQMGVVTAIQRQYSTGVVCFEGVEMALEAQQRFDGVELCGRKMSVCVWWPKSEQQHQEADSSDGEGSGSDLGGEEV